MLSLEKTNKLYTEVLHDGNKLDLRQMGLNDLFFLLTVIMGRKDMNREWLYYRCREVEQSPYDHIDLWARDHYKSTTITVGHSIQDVLNDPELTCGIFSHTQKIARAFLAQIMRTFETCDLMKELYDDVLYKEPQKQSPKWSVDEGIILKRKSNPKEATFEGWGLVSGQPTGKHFKRMIYDDIVTLESVSTPEQILKTTSAWELSLNLASQGAKYKYVGTRYHANDTYETMLKRNVAKPRIHAATLDGTDTGEPVLLSKEELTKKRESMGMYTFACQMLLDPLADKAMGFRREWLSYYEPQLEHIDAMNILIIVDPASGRNKKTDYTTMGVIGFNADRKRYLIYGIRDRLSLTERTDRLFALVKKFRPSKVRYEQYGMQADIEHIEFRQRQLNYRFDIEPIGGNISKKDRILALVPHFEKRKILLPISSTFIDRDGKAQDFTTLLVEDEYIPFPVCKNDDMLDMLARSVVDTEDLFPDANSEMRKLGMNYVEGNQKRQYDINRLTNKDYKYGFHV